MRLSRAASRPYGRTFVFQAHFFMRHPLWPRTPVRSRAYPFCFLSRLAQLRGQPSSIDYVNNQVAVRLPALLCHLHDELVQVGSGFVRVHL
jgi:hypothetical protein